MARKPKPLADQADVAVAVAMRQLGLWLDQRFTEEISAVKWEYPTPTAGSGHCGHGSPSGYTDQTRHPRGCDLHLASGIRPTSPRWRRKHPYSPTVPWTTLDKTPFGASRGEIRGISA